MRLPPIEEILTWPTPNYTNPVTQGQSLLIINVVFFTLVVLAVVGRFWSRMKIQKWFGVDDAMMVLAFVFTIAMTTVVILADVRYGWDRHIWDVNPDILQSANIIAFIAKITFTLAATFTRLSLIFFYYRLIKDTGIKWFVWVLHASVLWQIALCVTFVALTVWLCNPIEAYWLWPPPSTYQCLDEGKVMLGGGIVSTFSDLMTVALPIPIVMRLQMPLASRIGVCVLLGLGLIVTVAGSLRTYYTWKSLISSYDETWHAYRLWIAAAVEIDVGVICACAPALKSLLQQPVRSLRSKISGKLSSLRSPSSGATPNSSEAKPSVFRPLRSLPWFQITRMDFERTRRGGDEDDKYGRDVERDSSSAIELQEKGGARRWEEEQQEAGAQDSRYMGRTSSPSTPSLQIMMRQSFEQCSDYVGSDYQPPDYARPESGWQSR